MPRDEIRIIDCLNPVRAQLTVKRLDRRPVNLRL